MAPAGGGIYQAAIPPVSAPGVDFYIRATDGPATSHLPSLDPGLFPFQIAVGSNVRPLITHTPITDAIAGTDLAITAAVVDTTNRVDQVSLRWRPAGDLNYESVPMGNMGGNQFGATIPVAEIAQDLEYYIWASDDMGLASTAGTPDDPFHVSVTYANSIYFSFIRK
jgi:hypothetical protein